MATLSVRPNWLAPLPFGLNALPYAAIGLAIIMLGAVYFHLVYTPVVAAIPALMLLVFATVIALSIRSQAKLSQPV